VIRGWLYTYWEFIAGGIAIPILFILIQKGWRRMCNKLWPSRDTWRATLLDSSELLIGKEATRWRTTRTQQARDSFVLDIRKPNGKGRLMDKVWFKRGGYSANDTPVKVVAILQGERAVLPDWNRQDVTPKPGHDIVINLKHPEKITFIAIEIVEPRPNAHWAIEDILIREIKLRLKLNFEVSIKKAYIK